MSYRVRATVPAQQAIGEIAEWWQANRPKAPDLFESEMDWALSYLAHAPMTGMRETGKLRAYRKLLLNKCHYYLYYSVDEQGEVVEIVAIWHTARSGSPRI